MRPSLAIATLCACVLLLTRSAHAGNDDELLMGNHAAMTGGAVSATVRDGSAIWYNAAGLGAVQRAQFDVSGTAYTLRSYSVPRFLASSAGDSDNAAVSGFVSIPTQIAYVRRLASGLTLGLGYFVPHAENFILREGLNTGTPTDALQVQLSLLLAEVHHAAAAALGFALTPRLRVGFGLIGGYQSTTQAISFFSAVARAGATEAVSISSAFTTSTRLSVEGALGLQLEFDGGFELGVSARTPRVQVYESLRSSASDSSASRSQTDPENALDAETTEQKRDHAQFAIAHAGRIGLAIARHHGHGWLAFELDVQPGLRRPELEIARKAVINARLGLYQLITSQLALGIGLFTDRNSAAVREQLLGGSGDFYGATLGLEFSSEHLLAASEPERSLIFSSVFALRYAYSRGAFGRVVLSPDDGSIEGSAHGVLHVHELGLYVGSGLQF